MLNTFEHRHCPKFAIIRSNSTTSIDIDWPMPHHILSGCPNRKLRNLRGCLCTDQIHAWYLLLWNSWLDYEMLLLSLDNWYTTTHSSYLSLSQYGNKLMCAIMQILIKHYGVTTTILIKKCYKIYLRVAHWEITKIEPHTKGIPPIWQ